MTARARAAVRLALALGISLAVCWGVAWVVQDLEGKRQVERARYVDVIVVVPK